MEDLSNLYYGKVIHDSDLLEEGDSRPYNRVKVFILGINGGVGAEDFKQPRGSNNPKTVSTSTLELVGQELYAYVLMPVMGSGTSTKYNANKDILTVSDSGDITDVNSRPQSENYQSVYDGYTGGSSSGTAGVNVMAGAYAPDNKSNAYKGMMSLPGVGSTVVVSFMNGMRSAPIIIGTLPGGHDVDSLHGIGLPEDIYPNYPVAYSNLTERSEVDE